MTRLRFNGLTAELAADLSDSDTTINFVAALGHSAGTPLSTLTGGDYVVLSLIDGDGNLVEIVHLTGYTCLSHGLDTPRDTAAGASGCSLVSWQAGSVPRRPAVAACGDLRCTCVHRQTRKFKSPLGHRSNTDWEHSQRYSQLVAITGNRVGPVPS